MSGTQKDNRIITRLATRMLTDEEAAQVTGGFGAKTSSNCTTGTSLSFSTAGSQTSHIDDRGDEDVC